MSNGQVDSMVRAIQAAEDKLLDKGWPNISDAEQRLVLEGRRLRKQTDILQAITDLPDQIAERNKQLASQYCPYLQGEVPKARKPSRKRRIGVLAVSIPVAGAVAWLVEHIAKLLK